MAKKPERTYFTPEERRGIYANGRKIADPVIGGTPDFYSQSKLDELYGEGVVDVNNLHAVAEPEVTEPELEEEVTEPEVTEPEEEEVVEETPEPEEEVTEPELEEEVTEPESEVEEELVEETIPEVEEEVEEAKPKKKK